MLPSTKNFTGEIFATYGRKDYVVNLSVLQLNMHGNNKQAYSKM